MDDKYLEEIVEKAAAGDREALRVLCERKCKDILYISMHLLGNIQDAEDAAQNIILYLQEHITELQHPEAFQVWLYRIIRSECANMRRRNSRISAAFQKAGEHMEQERYEFLPQIFLEDKEKKEQLMKIICKLSSRQKMCVLLFYYQGMNYLEIAQILGVSKKSVDNTLMKAKRTIRKKLEKEGIIKRTDTKLYSVAAVPVLTSVLLSNANELITEEIVLRVSEKCTAHLASGLSAGAVLKGMSGKTTSGITGSNMVSGTAAKVTFGVIATAGVAGGVLLYQNKDKSQSEEPVVIAEEVKEPEFKEEKITEVVAEPPEEMPIHTLGDMIGEAEAAQLIEYTGRETAGITGMEEFLQSIMMEERGSIQSELLGFQDKIYVLEKQDKLLCVIIRGYEDTGNVTLAYRFSGNDELVPEDIEITLCFDEWQEE